jgi:MFS family permease
VALVVYVQQTQGRGVAVSALLLAATLPTLLGPLAGALVDRVDQRRLMLGAQAGQAVLYGAMAAVLPPFPVLLVLVAAASLLATVFAPTGRSVVPSLVPPGDLVRANSWMGMALTFKEPSDQPSAASWSPVQASAGRCGQCPKLRNLGRAGGWPALSCPQGADGQRVGLLKGTWEGLGYALGHPVARALVIGLGFGVMFAAVDDVALVFLAREDLHAGAVGYGVLVSLYGIGFALGSLALLRTRATAGVAVFVLGLALSGTGGLLTGLAPVLGLAALAQAVAGSGNGLEVVATDTLVQRSVPRSHRGRVFGVVSAATLLGGAIARGLGGVLVDSPPPGRPS